MAAHELTLRSLDQSGDEMIQATHYASEKIRVRLLFVSFFFC